MSFNQCPECGRPKRIGQSYKHIYRCTKCGLEGCISRDISMSRINDESCWPEDNECPAGGKHVRIRVDSVFSPAIA